MVSDEIIQEILKILIVFVFLGGEGGAGPNMPGGATGGGGGKSSGGKGPTIEEVD